MFEKVSTDAGFIRGEHDVLAFWKKARVFERLREQIRGKPHWSFIDGPITANNPMGVHHAWGRTYKDAFRRYFAMPDHDHRFQNRFHHPAFSARLTLPNALHLETNNP